MADGALNGLPADPLAVARVLRNLPGFVWLDSSDGSARWGGDLLAARPVRVESGRMPARWPGPAERGALWVGWIDYEGDWTFGLYPDWLRFDRAARTWSGSPALAGLAAGPAASDADTPGAALGALRVEMGAAAYMDLVRTAREFIAAGDIYQVNVSQRFSLDWPEEAEAWAAYLRLRALSPAPHAAFLDLGGRLILCASPETFLVVGEGKARTSPIKGTRPRGASAAEDEVLRQALLDSAKERAELVMITDLERNDLGRVARTGSVRVSSLCRIESFAQVHHLVSDVEAELPPGVGLREVMAACFPGGSITGAPKKRAMEIIAELEPGPRQLYTGAIGWTDGAGRGVFNIAIRTAWIESGTAVFPAGSGIVADSDPWSEYVETLYKARALAEALGHPGLMELARDEGR